MRSYGSVFGLPALLLLLFPFIAIGQHITAPAGTGLIDDTVHIPTRDGASIYAVVSRPGSALPLPAILFYTTYVGVGNASVTRFAMDKGYVGVKAYCRGIRTNLKDYKPFVNDGADAYDVIDWISKQSWCNGSVGMYSGSYTGFVQWAAMKNRHPALKTIVPQVAVMPGYDFPMENNVTLGFALAWSHNNIFMRPPLPPDLEDRWWTLGTSYRTLDSLAGYPNSIYQEWLQHPSYDAYWRSLVPTPEEYARIDIPILTTTGYYDGSQISALQYVRQHYRYDTNAEHYLVIGPYDHMGAQRNAPDTLMGYAIDPVARLCMRELAFAWFDHILKGAEKPAMLMDRINYQVMGTNEWKHAPSLAAMCNDTLTYYLAGTMRNGRYLLSGTRHEEPPVLQTVDFTDRTTQNNYFTPSITLDSIDASNGLVFASEPLSAPCNLNGSFTGNLVATIDKRDMDVSVALYEQRPDGTYFYLTRYLGRASYSHGDATRQLLRPGQQETIPFSNTRLVSRRLQAGSRIVAVLNINKHPYEPINYGSGKDVNDETIGDAGTPLHIQWHPDSYLRLPVWR